MMDREVLIIDVTPEERQRIENLAQQHGYETPGEYLLSLVADVEGQADEETKESILEEFRQGWHAAMTGDTIPASDLWNALNRDE